MLKWLKYHLYVLATIIWKSTRPKYAMKLVGRWTLLFTLSFFALTQSLGFRGLTKSLVLEGKKYDSYYVVVVSSFCKKPFFCQTMDLNFSLACQSRYELKIWIFFFLVSSQLAAAVDSDTNISRVLAFPFSDSLLVLFLL